MFAALCTLLRWCSRFRPHSLRFGVRTLCNDERWSLGFISVFQFQCDLCALRFPFFASSFFLSFPYTFSPIQPHEIAFNFRCTHILPFARTTTSWRIYRAQFLMAFLEGKLRLLTHNIRQTNLHGCRLSDTHPAQKRLKLPRPNKRKHTDKDTKKPENPFTLKCVYDLVQATNAKCLRVVGESNLLVAVASAWASTQFWF